ncbi:MAG: HAD family phosphatase [Eubacteriales bacterium]
MAFIFDLDGTLLDSMGIWASAGSNYLLSRGIIPEKGLDEKFKTFTLKEVVAYYRKVYHLSESGETLMDSVNDFIEKEYRENAPPKKGVKGFLETYHGEKMCIATATDRHLVEISLKIHGMSQYFSEIFTCTEVGVGKTKPDIYEIALAHLGTEKEDTIVFEDAVHGIISAKKAGFPVIAVADQSALTDKEEILQYADLYIESFDTEFLEEWKNKR